jgi:hypothetical protein
MIIAELYLKICENLGHLALTKGMIFEILLENDGDSNQIFLEDVEYSWIEEISFSLRNLQVPVSFEIYPNGGKTTWVIVPVIPVGERAPLIDNECGKVGN